MEEKGCPNFRRLFTTKFIKSHVKLPIKSDPQKVNSIADTLSSCKFQPPFQKQHPSASFAFGPATCSLTQKANFIWWMVWLIQLKFINLCTIDDYVSPNGSLLLTNEQTLLHWFFCSDLADFSIKGYLFWYSPCRLIMVSLVNYLKLQHLLCGIKLHQGSTHTQHRVVMADCMHVLFTLPRIIITQSTSCFGLPVVWVSLAFLGQRSLRSTPSLSPFDPPTCKASFSKPKHDGSEVPLAWCGGSWLDCAVGTQAPLKMLLLKAIILKDLKQGASSVHVVCGCPVWAHPQVCCILHVI